MTDFDNINSSRLGVTILDAIFDLDNLASAIGTALISALRQCESEQDYKTADAVVMAITGCSIETLIIRNKGEIQ